MGRGRAAAEFRPLPDRIVVPDLIGLIVASAMRRADHTGITLVVADQTVRLADLASSGRWIVNDQDPPAGSVRYRGDTVVIFVRDEGDGRSGDREPRRPLPISRSDRADPLEETPAPIRSLRPLPAFDALARYDALAPRSGD
jgi:PASTA domain